MAVATAIAVALHEILAALIPNDGPQTPSREIVAHAEVVRVAIHRPIPTRRHIVAATAVRTPSPHRIAHALKPRTASHRSSAAVHVSHRAAVLGLNARPVWDTGDVHAVVPGNGLASGTAGDGTQGHGTQGNGTQGTGNDAGAGEEPCGFVEFSDPHGSRYDRSTGGFYVDIRMSVHFADGSQQSLVLDYPWYYANENANPWSARNAGDPNFPTRFQAPPSAKLAAEPVLVQYVAQHSTADGMTLLRDCQGANEQRP